MTTNQIVNSVTERDFSFLFHCVSCSTTAAAGWTHALSVSVHATSSAQFSQILGHIVEPSEVDTASVAHTCTSVPSLDEGEAVAANTAVDIADS